MAETGRSLIPASLPVYQFTTVWSIKLSERKPSILLEELKLQTGKKPVELIDCSDEESEVRSFLQCLPYISQLSFDLSHYNESVKKQTEFLLKLFHQAAEREKQTGDKTLELLTSLCTDTSFPNRVLNIFNQTDFLLDLYSRMKQYETETGRSLIPALHPVYQSPAVWSIKLSERKPSLFLEVLKLQTEKKPVELRDYPDEESEVRSFLQCLPYISQLRLNLYEIGREKSIQFLISLSIAAADCQSDQGENFAELMVSVCNYETFPYDDECEELEKIQSDFLLDLYSHMKQHETETGRSLIPALLPVYQSPKVWSIEPSERKSSLLLEVLKLQREKKPVELRDYSYIKSDVRSFLQCLPYISQLRLEKFWCPMKDDSIQLLIDLSIAAADCQLDEVENITELLVSVCNYETFPYDDADENEKFFAQSDFLLDLYSDMKQHETETGRSLIPAFIPVYQSPTIWSIKLSERKSSLLLEVLKLQTEKKPVVLIGNSDEESEVRSFLQCLPYISHLRFANFFNPQLGTLSSSCSKPLLLQFLSLLQTGTESVYVRQAANLSKALDGQVDLSGNKLDLQVCKSLALVLEYSEGLSELDLSHCQLTEQCLDLLIPHLHKAAVLDLSHNRISDSLARRIYTVVSDKSNIQTVRLFNNRITDKQFFQKDKRFEI